MSSRVAGSSLVEGVLVDWAIAEPAWLPRLPVELLDREQTAAELQRVVAQRAMLAAYEAELVLNLADASPDGDDPPPGTRGARGSWGAETRVPGVSEFFPAELAMVLNCGRGTASHLAVRAATFRANLPGTWGALAAGVLDEPRARALADVLEHAKPDVARQVEAEVLPEASELSMLGLRKRAMAVLLRVDADAVEENRAEARRRADVRVYPSPRDGTSIVAAELPAEEAAAGYDTVDRLAAMLKADGDPRPIGQLRAQVFSDLLRRPWDTSRPAVTAHLKLSAPLGALAGESAEAGEVNGQAITAAHLRELVARLDALGPGGLRVPEGGSVTVAVTDDDGALLAAAGLEQLRRLARRGCLDHRDVECGCPLLGRPPEVDRYEPSDPQQTFVHTRDRTCRFPNCGQRVGWADADHVVAHACGGATDCGNLCCLCRSHHRLKTFARGWRFQMSDDGVLTVTTPSGVTRTTRPPGLRPPPDPDPAPAPAPPGAEPPGTGTRESGRDGPETAAPPPGIRELIARWRPPGPGGLVSPDDDPFPF